MKKVLSIVLIVLLICFTSCDKNEKLSESTQAVSSEVSGIADTIESDVSADSAYKIEYSFTLLENNNVGNEWIKSVFVNEIEYKSGEAISAKCGESVEIKICVGENDKIPDQNSKTVLLNIKDGEGLCETIAVCENRGKYSGNTALWQFSCRVIKK